MFGHGFLSLLFFGVIVGLDPMISGGFASRSNSSIPVALLPEILGIKPSMTIVRRLSYTAYPPIHFLF